MTQVKTLFIIDDATEIKAIAIKPDGSPVWKAAGFGTEFYVLFIELNSSGRCSYDPYEWRNRTMFVAHQTLIDHWDNYADGDRLDVRPYLATYIKEGLFA